MQGRNYVHLSVAEAYLSRLGLERRAARPKGWKTLKAVLTDSGAGRNTAMNAVRNGKLRAVLVGASIYVHPEDATAFALQHRNLKPLAGWVRVSTLKDEVGRSKEAVNQCLRRHRDKIEVRHYLHPVLNRPVPYIKEGDAARYRTIVAKGSAKHIGYCFRQNEVPSEQAAGCDEKLTDTP